jgi:dihydrofolate synthase/folylpolyglutamate synthase
MTTDPERYNETTAYLYDLQKHGIKLGLSNIERLTELLGKPQDSFRSIHVAGTNGKGSTATMIASILEAAGFRVGIFTSPHLVSFTERIRINRRPITESDVVSLTHEVKEAFTGTDLNPTFFEVVTALAFHYFSLKNVDWAVIETGMGGRFDATNIIQPEISIITNINMDHAEYLGDSISDITYEKAGIIKQGVPVVTAASRPDVARQLSEIAEEKGSPIHLLENDFSGTLLSAGFNRLSFNYKGLKYLEDISLNLSGRYQVANASLAIRAAEILSSNGVAIDDASIRNGLLEAKLEGRLEAISEDPYIILDSAHNPEAAGRLAETLSELFPHKKMIIVAGMMGDKDIAGILKPLLGISDYMVLTSPEGERAASPDELKNEAAGLMNSAGMKPAKVTAAGSIAEALDRAKRVSGADSVICVTGSFYTTGKVKELLGHKGVLSGLRE